MVGFSSGADYVNRQHVLTAYKIINNTAMHIKGIKVKINLDLKDIIICYHMKNTMRYVSFKTFITDQIYYNFLPYNLYTQQIQPLKS